MTWVDDPSSSSEIGAVDRDDDDADDDDDEKKKRTILSGAATLGPPADIDRAVAASTPTSQASSDSAVLIVRDLDDEDRYEEGEWVSPEVGVMRAKKFKKLATRVTISPRPPAARSLKIKTSAVNTYKKHSSADVTDRLKPGSMSW